ncbi:MAG TPA: hypothetical protein VFP39_00160 [Gemmatimonadales bacterium]|nr:hypothetical protein [Gemmatimonadales bacterium]
MKYGLLVLSWALTCTMPAAAQREADVALAQAKDWYEHLDVERALPLLRDMISPAWPYGLTPEQRATAAEYMGAFFVLSDVRDSALFYFRAAIEAVPLTDLDPQRFTPAQVALFHDARRQVLAVAFRPILASRIAPSTGPASFTAFTTHEADLTVVLRGGTVPRQLFQGVSDGLREVRWDGLDAAGTLVESGRYEIVATAASRVFPHSDSARLFIDVRREGPHPRDTLPDLVQGDLLPERYSAASTRRDIATGAGVAAAVLAIAAVVPNDGVGKDHLAGASVVAGTALVTGIVAALTHRRNAPLPANVAVNATARLARHAENARIRRSNADRLARTVLVITPVSGWAP